MFYIYLPPINIKSYDFWNFAVAAAVAGVIINFWSIIKGFTGSGFGEFKSRAPRAAKAVVGVVAAIIIFYALGTLFSSPVIRASAYRELLTVTDGDFSNDIKEVDYSQIPILDRDSAARLSERTMGSLVDIVSQFEVSDYYSQLNYRQRPVRVTPLEYGDGIKWLLNQGKGIPAYIRIDMTTQNVECIRLEEGMKYSPSELFNRDLNRHVRFKYPTRMFRSFNFEIDDDGTPYWICPVKDNTIGLFGGIDIVGAALVNAVTGETVYYDIEDVPKWVDKVYDAELLVEQYDYYGTLKNGFINSVLGQRDCLKTTDGYNYIALDDDVWVYTGVTSVSGDQSNVGFVLMNQRTKLTKYYTIAGAEEFSAMSSAEGQVQHLGYTATFPLLLNVGGEPTYFLALKDSAGLVKKYAMVNIQKYQIVATGDTVAECEKNYRSLMKTDGITTVDEKSVMEITGVISRIIETVYEGNSIYYVMLEGDRSSLYEIDVRGNLEILRKSEGDEISMEFIADSLDDGISEVISVN